MLDVGAKATVGRHDWLQDRFRNHTVFTHHNNRSSRHGCTGGGSDGSGGSGLGGGVHNDSLTQHPGQRQETDSNLNVQLFRQHSTKQRRPGRLALLDLVFAA